jgi:hypothetical protein
MKVLLDKCIAAKCKRGFPKMTARPSRKQALPARVNGELKDLVERDGCNAFLTPDKGIE